MLARRPSSRIPRSDDEENRRQGAAEDWQDEIADAAPVEPARRFVQFTPVVERGLKSAGDLPEQVAIKNDDTPENRRRKHREGKQADMQERARALLEEQLKALTYVEKGEVAAYRVYICREDRDDVARALYLDPATCALRVAMRRALDAYPCGETPGQCEGTPDCAHRRGKELWETIIRRVISKLSAQ